MRDIHWIITVRLAPGDICQGCQRPWPFCTGCNG